MKNRSNPKAKQMVCTIRSLNTYKFNPFGNLMKFCTKMYSTKTIKNRHDKED